MGIYALHKSTYDFNNRCSDGGTSFQCLKATIDACLGVFLDNYDNASGFEGKRSIGTTKHVDGSYTIPLIAVGNGTLHDASMQLAKRDTGDWQHIATRFTYKHGITSHVLPIC